jgi:LmbE family N-acetylglucosaminyl deacetylase
VLGVHDHEFMGYPDGGCDEVDPTEPIDRLSDVILRLRPRTIVTFGPDGITGHPDHIAVSKCTTAAWATAGIGDLLYATSTESFMQRFAVVHRRLGLFAADAPRIDDADVDLAVELDAPELRTERLALAAHDSQTSSFAAQMGVATYRRWYAVETLRRPTAIDVHAATMVSAS